MDVTDPAAIDDRNGDALGVDVRHDLADFGVDCRAARYCLSDSPDGYAEGSKKGSKERKNLFQHAQGEVLSELDAD